MSSARFVIYNEKKFTEQKEKGIFEDVGKIMKIG